MHIRTKTKEGFEFSNLAERLALELRNIPAIQKDANDSDRVLPIQNVIRNYFDFLRKASVENTNEPGVLAEIQSVIMLAFPLDTLEAYSLHSVIVDLSAIYLDVYCKDEVVAPVYYNIWKERCPRREDWLEFVAASAQRGSPVEFSADLHINHVVAKNLLGQVGLDYEIKSEILELIAGILPEGIYNPESTLKEINAEYGITESQLLNLQIWQYRGFAKESLARHFAPINGSIEATLLFWVNQYHSELDTEFLKFLFKKWGWLKEIDLSYKWESSVQSKRPELLRQWEDGSHPEGLIRREDGYDKKSLIKMVINGNSKEFEPIDILIIGPISSGKTAFLCAFTKRIIEDGLRLGNQVGFSSQELFKLWDEHRNAWYKHKQSNTADFTNYRSRLILEKYKECGYEPSIRFTDFPGERIKAEKITEEFVHYLNSARALVFLIDHRFFPDTVLNSDETYLNPREYSAWYSDLLIMYFQNNQRSLHTPVALVLNQADKIFGLSGFRNITKSGLIDDRVNLANLHAERPEYNGHNAYERLRQHIMHSNESINAGIKTQRRIIETLDNFKPFIETAIENTYNFQVFTTSSVIPSDGGDYSDLRGVVDTLRWVTQVLIAGHDRQLKEVIRREINDLSETYYELRENLHHLSILAEQWKEFNAGASKKRLPQLPRALKWVLPDHRERLNSVQEQLSTLLNSSERSLGLSGNGNGGEAEKRRDEGASKPPQPWQIRRQFTELYHSTEDGPPFGNKIKLLSQGMNNLRSGIEELKKIYNIA